MFINFIQIEHVLYFAVFWTIWSKETSYATRFDTTDLSAQLETLLTCFAVLFASLSVSLPMSSEGGVRIMIMAAFCSSMHFFLMTRVLWWYSDASDNSVEYHVKQYAVNNLIMNFTEATAWIIGIFYAPLPYRWIVFIVGVLLGLRIPRSILPNDFHGEYDDSHVYRDECTSGNLEGYMLCLHCLIRVVLLCYVTLCYVML